MTTWGPWSSDGRFRAGIDLIPNPTSIGSGTSTQLVTAQVRMQTRDNSSEYNFGNNWFLTGSISGSGQTDYNLGSNGIVFLGQANRTVTTSHVSTVATTVTARFHRNASPGAGQDASVTATYTTPTRPYSAPAQPTGLNATRWNDGQANLTWYNNSTYDAPYSTQTVQMRTFTGSAWGPYVNAGTVSAGATAYSKTGLSRNHIYQFQIRANGPAGSSAYYASGAMVWMTPEVPANPDSALSASGTQIVTTWDETAYFTSPRVTYTIQRSVAGGAWTQVASGLVPTAGLPGAWADPAPGAGVNQYRVQAVAPSAGGSLTSGWGTADPVSTVVPPLAPTLLAPNGKAVDLTLAQTFTFKHNPGGDKAAQSRYQARYSTNGGSTWVTLKASTASTVASFVVAAGTLTNGVPYLWQVATQGAATAGFGPYSASAALTGSTTPVVTLTAGHPANPTVQLPLDTWWVYQQDQGSPQAAWQAQLLTADGLTILKAQTGDTDTALVWAYPVTDGVTYLVKVRAQSGAGIWSNWAQTSTTVTLPSPGPAVVTPLYDVCTGTMILHITAAAPVAPAVAVQYVVIERRVEGGDWVTLSDYFDPDGDFIDIIPLTHGLNEYRLTSVSSVPTYIVNPVVAAPGLDGFGGEQWVLVAYGDGFTNVLRFHGDPKVTENAGRAAAGQPLLGRGKPLAMFGENTQHELDVGGSLFFDTPCDPGSLCGFDSPPADWVAATQTAEVVCYRDYTGRRLFGFISGVGVTDGTLGTADVGFHFTETEFSDAYGSARPVEGV